MRWIAVVAMLATSMVAVNHAEARGCLKGAIVGGIAGHMAGHGMMGAAAGCAVGHHYANKPSKMAPTSAPPADSSTTAPAQ